MRANFTQENIEKMKAFDPELARKAQLAYDHKLPINFQQLEIIDEALPRLREEVSKLPIGGPYHFPAGLDISAARPVPGQKDLQGTMMELAELQDPGSQARILEGPAADVKQLP